MTPMTVVKCIFSSFDLFEQLCEQYGMTAIQKVANLQECLPDSLLLENGGYPPIRV
jgi:hypothetical protein